MPLPGEPPARVQGCVLSGKFVTGVGTPAPSRQQRQPWSSLASNGVLRFVFLRNWLCTLTGDYCFILDNKVYSLGK